MHWHWSILIRSHPCARMDRHARAALRPHHQPPPPSGAILFKGVQFNLVTQLSLALAGGLVVDGCTRRCRRRHRECPPPERATPPLALASRADGGRKPSPSPRTIAHSARRRQGPERWRSMASTKRYDGTRCTTRPRPGSASPPRAGSAACCGTSVRACT